MSIHKVLPTVVDVLVAIGLLLSQVLFSIQERRAKTLWLGEKDESWRFPLTLRKANNRPHYLLYPCSQTLQVLLGWEGVSRPPPWNKLTSVTQTLSLVGMIGWDWPHEL